MNKVIETGYIANDIVINKSDSGNSFVRNSISVRRDYKNAEGRYDYDFIRFTAFGKIADYIAQYANKGDYIALEGKWETGSYEGKDGKVRTDTLIVKNVELLPKAKKEKEQQAEEITIDPEELPFY